MMYAVPWLLGNKWSDAVPLIPAMVMLFGSSLYSNVIGGVTFIRRKPGLALTWTTAALIIKSGAMLWGLQTSFTNAVLAFALAGVLMNICFNLISMHQINVSLKSATGKILLSLLPVGVYALLLIPISRFNPVAAIVISILIAGSLFPLLDWIYKGKLKSDLKEIFSFR
jgi:O-antigen/teichoic acid export membrane protein